MENFHENFEASDYFINSNDNTYSLNSHGDRIEYVINDNYVSVESVIDNRRFVVVRLYNTKALNTFLHIYQTYIIESGILKEVIESRIATAFILDQYSQKKC